MEIVCPFCLNDVAHATSPVNFSNTWTAGKPIVTTGMLECKRYRSVLWGDTADEIFCRIAQALTLRDDPQYLALLRKEALENTWEERAAKVYVALRSRHRKAERC